ncbi:hypothetical protein ABT023_16160 [Micromonospora sp. NPDC002296]|uniref:hypothetical protein n=1 Tax=Micromonospora sp. NPDC002296 TaxID=3154271 RepID=UPI00332FF387
MASPKILITGTVPDDSPATALAGRTVTLPAANLGQVAQRVTEATRARVRPHITTAGR